jgi:hypothetical protein
MESVSSPGNERHSEVMLLDKPVVER